MWPEIRRLIKNLRADPNCPKKPWPGTGHADLQREVRAARPSN